MIKKTRKSIYEELSIIKRFTKDCKDRQKLQYINEELQTLKFRLHYKPNCYKGF